LKANEQQIKAALKQQRMQEEMSANEQMADKNRGFVKDLFSTAENQRRETQRQNLVTAFNIVGTSAGSVI
jgi:hypothetical protein